MELHFTMSGRCLLDVCVCCLQMFAPLLEGGALRNDHDELYDFAARFPLRHNALVDHHVSVMRKLVHTRGVTAMLDYSTPMSCRRLLDVCQTC